MRSPSVACAVAALVVLLLGACLSPGAARTALPEQGQAYRIVNVAWDAPLAAPLKGGETLPVFAKGDMPKEGAVWAFKFHEEDGDSWEIIHKATGKVLDVQGGSKDEPVPVNAFPQNGTKAQRFLLEREGAAFRIVAQVSGMVLTGKGAPESGSGPLIQLPWEGRETQLWVLEPVGGPPAASRKAAPDEPAIHGTVVDQDTGEGLGDLEMRLYEPPMAGPVWSGRTGPKGGFGIKDFKDGSFDLAVEPSDRYEGSYPLSIVIKGGKAGREMPLRIEVKRKESAEQAAAKDGRAAELIFALKHGSTGLFLTVKKSSSGPVLALSPFTPGDASQAWFFQALPGGGVVLKSPLVKMAIGVPDSLIVPGAAVGLVPESEGRGRRWAVKREADGSAVLVALDAPLALQPAKDGKGLALAPVLRDPSQRWVALTEGGKTDVFALAAKPAGDGPEAGDKAAGSGVAAAPASEGKLASFAGKKLAVVSVSSANKGITAETLTAVQDFLIHAFVTGSKCTVLDRTSIDKILKEHEFQVSDLADTGKAVEIGKLAGAEAIVVGSLNMVGSKYYLTVKLVSVTTGEILASAIGEGADASAFLEMCLAAVRSM